VDWEVVVEWTFGAFLWSMVVVFFWVAVIWMFIGVFADIIRRDMSGWAKAGWTILIVILPFLGVLLYLITRPRTPYEAGDPYRMGANSRRPEPGYRAADEIAQAARLHDQGRISADEFEQIKHHALNA
jgi:hypothetical protein